MSKPPTEEELNLTTSTILLEKHQQLKNLREQLRLKKEEFTIKMKALEERRLQFEMKEQKYNASVHKFDTFYKENEDKRMRANRKLNAEKASQKEKSKEIVILNASIKHLGEKRNRLDSKVRNFVQYKLFLDDVIQRSEIFQEIPDLVTRYDALTNNLKDLEERAQQLNLVAERRSFEFHKYKEDKTDKNLTMTNQIAELQKALEHYQVVCRQKQNAWEYAQDSAASRIFELSTIKTAIRNMYDLVRTYQKYGDPALPDDLYSQLQAIQLFISDLTEITKELSVSYKQHDKN